LNFETKYLIRWGIPGWLMMMVLMPFFITIHFDFLVKHIVTSTNLLALGAALTILGVPLGYLLNQIHHSLFWVLPRLGKERWDEYFTEELELDEKLKGEEEYKYRYTYLLSRKHELGGITVSLGISTIVLMTTMIWGEHYDRWSWVYISIVFVNFLIILLSRQYSSQNLNKYYDYYLNIKKDTPK
jgi:O-antigen/teichoic acid export membrane protein